MNSKEILEKIKILSNEEKIKINYENLKEIMEYMTPDEIIELSNIIGYPVFTRLCMGVLQHKFVLLQDGAAAIIINNEGKILLQSRADRESGKTRRNSYPNGDVVINNTVLYCIRNYAGELRWDEESKEMKFFDLNNLPKNQTDSDLIEIYKKYKRK